MCERRQGLATGGRVCLQTSLLGMSGPLSFVAVCLTDDHYTFTKTTIHLALTPDDHVGENQLRTHNTQPKGEQGG